MFGYTSNAGAQQLSHARTRDQYYARLFEKEEKLRNTVEEYSAKIAAQIIAKPEGINTWLSTAITKHRELTRGNLFKYSSQQRAKTLNSKVQDAKATLQSKLSALQVALQDGNEDADSFKTVLFHNLLQAFLTPEEGKALESQLLQAYSYKPYGTFMEMVIEKVNAALAPVNNRATIGR